MAVVAQHGSVSSFIEPDRSITNAISRGLAIATADALVLNVDWPSTRAKNKGDLPLTLSSRRAVTLTALPPTASGVNVRVVESHRPISTSAAARSIGVWLDL